jgi:hypothetical protein
MCSSCPTGRTPPAAHPGVGNDEDDRAAVAAVGLDDLDLVGLALHGPRNAVEKVVKGARMHP